jgi:hypothetical protein
MRGEDLLSIILKDGCWSGWLAVAALALATLAFPPALAAPSTS